MLGLLILLQALFLIGLAAAILVARWKWRRSTRPTVARTALSIVAFIGLTGFSAWLIVEGLARL